MATIGLYWWQGKAEAEEARQNPVDLPGAKDIDLSIFEHSVAELRSLEEKHIVDLARNYLHPEEFTQVFVGQF